MFCWCFVGGGLFWLFVFAGLLSHLQPGPEPKLLFKMTIKVYRLKRERRGGERASEGGRVGGCTCDFCYRCSGGFALERTVAHMDATLHAL